MHAWRTRERAAQEMLAAGSSSAAASCSPTMTRPQLVSPSILASAGVLSDQGSRSRSGTAPPNRLPSSCARWPAPSC